MSRLLDDARSKLRRAQKHLKAIGRRITSRNKRLGNRPPYDVEIEVHDTYLLARTVNAIKVPSEWALIAGDAVANFRAALDYAAWQMVKAGSSPTPKSEERIAFPIQMQKSNFPKQVSNRLPGVRSDHLAVVERHQPYHWGTRSLRHPLQILADLSRMDKHRRIPVVLPAHKAYSGRVKCEGWHDTKITVPRPGVTIEVKPGTELFRIHGYPLVGQQPKVYVDYQGAIEITFENGAPIMEALGRIDAAVSMILKELDPML